LPTAQVQNHPDPSPRLKQKYIMDEAMLIKNGGGKSNNSQFCYLRATTQYFELKPTKYLSRKNKEYIMRKSAFSLLQ